MIPLCLQVRSISRLHITVSSLPVRVSNEWSYSHVGRYFTYPYFSIFILSTDRKLIVDSQETRFLEIVPTQWSHLQLFAPAPDSKQCPPLRNHQHEAAACNTHLHHAKTLRTLHEPFLIPAKSSIDVSTYRALVYPPAWNHRVHVTEVVGQEGVHKGEGDERQSGGVDKCVNRHELG